MHKEDGRLMSFCGNALTEKTFETNEIVNMNVSYKELPLTDKW